MNSMSPRERRLALIVISVVALAAVYQFVIDPYLAKREELRQRTTAVETDLRKAAQVFQDQRNLQADLKKLTAGGLKSDVAEARSQLLYALSGWTKESGLNFTSIKEGRTVTDDKWIQINIQLTGTGNQAAIAQLLWRLETASIPVRVTEMTINARKEGTDDLQINLNVSTLCENPNAKEPAPRRTVASAAGKE